jgi:RHH-type transcriptional regulator, rel operon repressor / antitoxin RelB
MSAVVTVRVDEDLRDKLEQLAAVTKRSKSFLAAEALREYVNAQQWQIEEIQAGVREADAGDLKPHDDVMRKLDEKLAHLLDQSR